MLTQEKLTDSRAVQGVGYLGWANYQRASRRRSYMYVLCEEGRWQIENSDVVRTSMSNAGVDLSASLVRRSCMSKTQ